VNPIIEFKPVDPKGPGVVAGLGDGFFVPDADGGWAVISRDSRVGITEFQGSGPITMSIPIIFDQFDEERSVEHLITAMYKIMRRRVGKRVEPAVIELRRFPVPFRNLQGVITGISPGEEIRRSKDGLRIRAAMTVSVMEYVAGDIVIIKKKSPSQKILERLLDRDWF
jgi:hypothetical protein